MGRILGQPPASPRSISSVAQFSGLTLPLPALLLAWDLERRGFRLSLDADTQVVITPRATLTDTDRAAIRGRRLHLGAIVACDADTPEPATIAPARSSRLSLCACRRLLDPGPDRLQLFFTAHDDATDSGSIEIRTNDLNHALVLHHAQVAEPSAS